MIVKVTWGYFYFAIFLITLIYNLDLRSYGQLLTLFFYAIEEIENNQKNCKFFSYKLRKYPYHQPQPPFLEPLDLFLPVKYS